jgi:hypothetical protein
MKGYIYITGTGVDPARRGPLADPTFGKPPTLGACMPNVRRNVDAGDWIFVMSGKLAGAAQYLVGGLRVAEKVDASVAFLRLPGQRLANDGHGRIAGNIVVRADGTQDPLDWHGAHRFEQRRQNFIIGDEAFQLSTPREVELARTRTLPMLRRVLHRPGAERVIDAMGRMSRLDQAQVRSVLDWAAQLKADAAAK